MATKNDITGDTIRTKTPNELYYEGYDRIFQTKMKTAKWEEIKNNKTTTKKKKFQWWPFTFIFVLSFNLSATELVHKFGSPSFSGINQSAHYLTIDEQERTRKEKLKSDAQEALEEAQRDADNTTLAKFLRNLESRIYSTLAKDISESLFDYNNPGTLENPITGTIWLEGNKITWINNGETITLIVEEWMDGVMISSTTITIPVGEFGGCFSDCAG